MSVYACVSNTVLMETYTAGILHPFLLVMRNTPLLHTEEVRHSPKNKLKTRKGELLSLLAVRGADGVC